jgi:hypothetical protein
VWFCLGPIIEHPTGTIIHPRKTRERLPLSLFLHRASNYSVPPQTYCKKVHGDDGRSSMSKDSSLDFSVTGNKEKDVLEYYAKKKISKYAVTDVVDSPVSVPHSRAHSQIYSPPYTLTPFMPMTTHCDQQLVGSSRYPSSNIPSSQSGESLSFTDPRTFCFEPSYNTLGQVRVSSTETLKWRSVRFTIKR